MKDPTREELIAFLESQYCAATGEEEFHTEAEADSDDHDGCGCRFDIEEAAYYLAAHYHGGQETNLYSAMSTSLYDLEGDALPDDLEDESCERINSTLLYLEGQKWIKDVDELTKLWLDCSKIDWAMLKWQKLDLVELAMEHVQSTPLRESLDGVVHFLDYLQDEAAKVLGEEAVFGKPEEDTDERTTI